MKKLAILTSLLLVLVLMVAYWLGGLPPVTPEAVAQEEVEIPFLDRWAGSGHNDTEAEAFNHWNEDSPAEIPEACARCHSTPGYIDWIGADGTAAGAVEAPAEIGTTIQCIACHNDVTLTKTSVVMPSGIELTDLGDESRCMECHQGRESTVSVNEFIETAGVEDDVISEDLGFRNIHYFAAAATKYGTLAKGGYEYEGKSYDGNFAHVDQFDTCIECHDMHSLEVKVEQCSACHAGVTTVDDLKDVRMPGSLVDYDGDGNVDEGIYFELEGLQALLFEAIQAYADDVSGTPIAYDVAAYPYFLNDAGEGYNAWTPRLLKAAYNYQVSFKDPGAFAHGGKYIIQLLNDSIEDLNTALSTPVDLSNVHRVDAGHFAGSEEAFRHWDEDGEVPASCSKCHSTAGLPLKLKDNATISQHLPNGFQCTTCHESLGVEGGALQAPRYQVDEVAFPSGAVLSFGEGVDSNLCLECHQGRESKYSVDALLLGLDEATIADLSSAELLDLVETSTQTVDDDTVADNLGFLNIHYFAAGATRFGAEAKGAYEYDGKEYAGFFDHFDGYQACTDCHNTHSLQVKTVECGDCHEGVETLEDLDTIRESETDFDGDGDTTEGLRQEVNTMRDVLYAAIQDYAASTTGIEPIVYNAQRHPYFFIDNNGNGEIDEGEADRYATWTPRLLKAAYNYQYSQKDPGAFAHNGSYILQILYDSLEDIGGDASDMTRPE
jgi:hypothetical protein